MKYPIKITQVLEGYVEIEADSLDEALNKADIMYNREGHELPDMDDGSPLTFSDPNEVKVYEDLLTQFIRHEVPSRFENLLETEVSDEIVEAVIQELQDNVDVMFAHERFDSWLLDRYEKFSSELDAGKQSFAMSMDTSGLSVAGHVGTWHTIDHIEVDGHTFWLMEHDTYGDDTACIILDENGKLSLSDVYNGFDEHTVDLLRQEVMPVDRMPDPSIFIEDMKDYGYAWGGMLPMGEEAAVNLWNMNVCPVYRLYEDDTEGMVDEVNEFRNHAEVGGIFGVEKIEWKAVLERQNSLADKIQDAQQRVPDAQASEKEPER